MLERSTGFRSWFGRKTAEPSPEPTPLKKPKRGLPRIRRRCRKSRRRSVLHNDSSLVGCKAHSPLLGLLKKPPLARYWVLPSFRRKAGIHLRMRVKERRHFISRRCVGTLTKSKRRKMDSGFPPALVGIDTGMTVNTLGWGGQQPGLGSEHKRSSSFFQSELTSSVGFDPQGRIDEPRPISVAGE